MARAAYLRVYIPAEQHPDMSEHVAQRVDAAPVLTRGEFGLSEESTRDDAFVIEHRGRRYVCPRYPRLRMLEGLIAFRNAFQGPTGAVLVPQSAAERAARELERIYSRFPEARSHILTSSFYVPLRWFAAFDPEDRALVDASGGLTIRYRTEVAPALDRLRRVAEVLENAGFDEAVVGQVTGVVEWMEGFPADAVVELDYAGVASLFSEAELALDESAAEIGASIDALDHGDYEQAGELYAAAATRWAHAQSLSFLN